MFAFATVTLQNGKPEVLQGHPRSANPAYSKAWLDTVIIRDNATSVLTARIVPRDDYPYSHTYEQFVAEVNRYAELNKLDETSVGNAYNEVVELFYYTAAAMGMTDDLPTMAQYLRDYGIEVPANIDPKDTPTVAVVYAAIKYNAIYTLYNKQVTFPKGITLQSAEIIILSELTGVFLPSGVNSINGFAVQAVKSHVEEFKDLPLSQNPSNAEVFHWSKILTAAANHYQVPLTPYEETTKAQRDYVDYAYFASIINTLYDVQINPARLAVADASAEQNALQKVILQGMLDSKEMPYSNTASCEELFNQACAADCFLLDEEFYSDIFNYDLYTASDCEKVWFTPIALASQLGGNDENVTVYLNGAQMRPGSTAAAMLDPAKATEDIRLTVTYDDGTYANNDMVTYVFHVVKNGESSVMETGSDLLMQMQTLLDSAVPAETEAAQSLVNEVISTVESNSNSDQFALNTFTTYDSSLFATIPVDDAETSAASGQTDFGYLGKLLDETYAANETAVASDPSGGGQASQSANASLIARTFNAIKENPEIAAAPTGIIAFGGLVGYFWNKKRKEEHAEEPETDETEEIDDSWV